MKTFVLFFLILIVSKILAQSKYENIRIFSSTNDQTEISAAINSFDPRCVHLPPEHGSGFCKVKKDDVD